jgi:hypothetical protein
VVAGGVSLRPEPVVPERLLDVLADLVAARAPGDQALRVGVDGAPPAGPGRLADALVDPLRLRGRAAVRVSAEGFLRPASVRLEQGRTDPDAFYTDRLDLAGLRRELLDPLGPGGTGAYLPSLWDPVRDRATRAGYEQAPPGAVLLLDGTMLLGAGLPLDLVVHLRLSAGALARRTPEAEAWTLPAYQRYEDEVDPAGLADVVVRADDPRHPAIIVREWS